MKRIVLIFAAFLILSSTCFAASLNDLASDQTALGIGTHNVYLEHKFNDVFTLGLQNESLSGGLDMNDVYGQFKLTGNLRGIIGSRSFDSTSRFYGGLGVSFPMAGTWQGYASLVGGDMFSELQVGANLRLSATSDLNIGYYSYMPDGGSNKTGVNVGVTFKF